VLPGPTPNILKGFPGLLSENGSSHEHNLALTVLILVLTVLIIALTVLILVLTALTVLDSLDEALRQEAGHLPDHRYPVLPGPTPNIIKGFSGLLPENGSIQGQNLALTVLILALTVLVLALTVLTLALTVLILALTVLIVLDSFDKALCQEAGHLPDYRHAVLPDILTSQL